MKQAGPQAAPGFPPRLAGIGPLTMQEVAKIVTTCKQLDRSNSNEFGEHVLAFGFLEPPQAQSATSIEG
jgi:hypothetical protein